MDCAAEPPAAASRLPPTKIQRPCRRVVTLRHLTSLILVCFPNFSYLCMATRRKVCPSLPTIFYGHTTTLHLHRAHLRTHRAGTALQPPHRPQERLPQAAGMDCLQSCLDAAVGRLGLRRPCAHLYPGAGGRHSPIFRRALRPAAKILCGRENFHPPPRDFTTSPTSPVKLVGCG